MDNAEIAQNIMAVDVAFGTFVAILQVCPQDSLPLPKVQRPRRVVAGVMGRMGRAAASYFGGIVLQPISGAMAQARVVKSRVRVGN
jgi:hypothetical protein